MIYKKFAFPYEDYAPPRSGKGVGLVVPTMITWPHSAVVTDLKREIYEATARKPLAPIPPVSAIPPALIKPKRPLKPKR
jgi:type IV secretory system conjugative DNA transfer VirD4/TraG family protein